MVLVRVVFGLVDKIPDWCCFGWAWCDMEFLPVDCVGVVFWVWLGGFLGLGLFGWVWCGG